MSAVGWFCPACQKHHAPHVETCPAPVDLIGTKTVPRFPSTSLQPYFGPGSNGHPGYDPCANCKVACGNAACQKRMTITCNNTAPEDIDWSSADLVRPS